MKARLLLVLSIAPSIGFGQLTVTNTLTPEQLVQNVLLGSGVTVSNVTFNGGPATTMSMQAGQFDGTSSNIGMATGLILATGDDTLANGPNDFGGGTAGGGNFGFGDPDLTQFLNGTQTNDAAILEFDFIPNGDTLRFNYVFGSEEYDEWTCSGFTDAFGFFLSGPGIAGPYSNGAINIALVPGTTVPIAINSVNLGVPGSAGNAATCAALDPNWTNNNVYYVQNNPVGPTVEYDGFTVVLEAFAVVQCGQQYHIKLAIADASDTILDSGVFLEGGSFTSTAAVTASLATAVGLQDSTLYEGCATAILGFTRYAGFTTVDTVQVTIGGTATMGVDFSPMIPPEIVFQPGDTTIYYVLTAPIDADLLETVDLTISNVAQCSGQLVVTDFTFYIDEAQPMYIAVSDTTIDCDDIVTIGPTVYQGYGNYGYSWSNGATTPTITVSPPVTTTYTVTVTDTCGMVPQSGTITITVPVFPPVSVVASSDTAIVCLTTADLWVVASGGDGFYTYLWTNSAGDTLGTAPTLTVTAGPPATYFVNVEAGCGLGDSESVLVTPAPLPPVTVSTNNDTTVLCPGDQVDLLVASATGGNGVYTYLWTYSTGATLSTNDTVAGITVNDTATYYVQVDDQCGNSGSDSMNVFTPYWEPYQLFVANDTAICLDQSTTIWAYATGGAGGYVFDWSNPGGGSMQYLITPGLPDTYAVTVTDQCGYTLADAVFVDVQWVDAAFMINYTDEYDVTFFNLSSPNCTQYLWEFGDGDESTAMHTAHHYIDTEDHDVWLTVWNNLGCVDSTTVRVQPPAHLYMPNAFSPDGDGVNDWFGPGGHDLYEFEMLIFDRWGEMIYSTEDAAKPWDGMVNGTPATNDVYVWKLKARGRRFGPVEYIGSVALVR